MIVLGAVVTSEEVAEKMQTTPKSEMPITIRNSGQSK